MYQLSSFIRLDKLRSYFDDLIIELKTLCNNPPENFNVGYHTMIFIIVLVRGKPLNNHDAYLHIDTKNNFTIEYYRGNFQTLIRDLIDKYESKKRSKPLPIIQNYMDDDSDEE